MSGRTFDQYIFFGLLFCLLISPTQVQAQTGVITGQVRMAGYDDPLSGVIVHLVETTFQDTIDADGMFTLIRHSAGNVSDNRCDALGYYRGVHCQGSAKRYDARQL